MLGRRRHHHPEAPPLFDEAEGRDPEHRHEVDVAILIDIAHVLEYVGA